MRYRCKCNKEEHIKTFCEEGEHEAGCDVCCESCSGNYFIVDLNAFMEELDAFVICG